MLSGPRLRTTTSSVFALTLATALLAALPAPAAAATRTFRQATAKDFEEGEATGATVLPTGELVQGMVTTRLPVDAAFVWCSAVSRDGTTAYFGTGDEGKIFAAPIRGGGGKGAEDRPARRLADLDAAWVTALVSRADGTLLAGTTPGGRIFSIDPKSGAAREIATVGADHVWALVRDD